MDQYLQISIKGCTTSTLILTTFSLDVVFFSKYCDHCGVVIIVVGHRHHPHANTLTLVEGHVKTSPTGETTGK